MIRYPYVSAEILSSESSVVASNFFKPKVTNKDSADGEDKNGNNDEVITD